VRTGRNELGESLVSEPGEGFGGRALCLNSTVTTGSSYELEVEVKLDDEAGAGRTRLRFRWGGRPLRLLPLGGRMRLTRFEGPDVQSWTILGQFDAASCQPGEWNRLRVRVEPDRIIGFVNGQEWRTWKIPDRGKAAPDFVNSGRASAEFRRFRVATKLEDSGPSPEKTSTALPTDRAVSPDARRESSSAILEQLLAAPDDVPASLEAVAAWK